MISISIVTYGNTFFEVRRCLENFITASFINEVVICENTEQALLDEKELKAFSSKIAYVSNPENTGYGAGHNLAFSNLASTTRYHVIMNLDVEVHKETFETLLRYMDENESVVHAMPKVLNTDGSIQRLCKKLPTPVNLIGRRFMRNIGVAGRIDEDYTLKLYEYDHVLDCPYLSGCFMFLRTETFQAVNGFDERFFMYPEDIDLTRRLHERGKTVCYPFASIVHEHGQASYKSKKMLMIHVKGIVKYFFKWGWFIDLKRNRFNRELQRRIATYSDRRRV
jgi:GT2 family glycosyltransferase